MLLPSGHLTVCHGKWPIEIDGLPNNSMVIFHGELLNNQMVAIPKKIETVHSISMNVSFFCHECQNVPIFRHRFYQLPPKDLTLYIYIYIYIFTSPTCFTAKCPESIN